MRTLLKKLSISAVLVTLSMLVAGQAFAQGFSIPSMKVHSNAFEDGGIVPMKYSSHGDNVQPDFTITDAPDNTVAYAIIFHDLEVAIGGPDDVLHWLAWNISSANIPEGSLPEGSVHGANIARQNAYMGPGAPKSDRYHHYVFEFYALSTNLDLPATASRPELLEALKAPGVVIAKAAYIGKFTDPR